MAPGSALASSRPITSHTKFLAAHPPACVVPNALLGASLALSHHLETEMDRALAIVPLTARSFVALWTLQREPLATQRHLASRLGLAESTISELLRRLQRRGLVRIERGRKIMGRKITGRRGATGERSQPSGSGGRAGLSSAQATLFELTARGRAALAKAERIAVRTEKGWAKRLSVAARSPWLWARAYGLRRWLCESLAALAGHAEPPHA